MSAHIDKRHFNIKGNRKKNLCTVCELKFYIECSYKHHVETVHSTNEEFKEKEANEVDKKEKKEIDSMSTKGKEHVQKETYEDEESKSNHKELKEKEELSKKHTKHLCKVCKVSFENAKKLTNHVKTFHDFSNEDTDEEDVIVLAKDDLKAPSSIEEFKKEKNKNVCQECKLKFLNGRMFKGHMSEHHPEMWKQMQKNTEESGKRQNPKRDVKKRMRT